MYYNIFYDTLRYYEILKDTRRCHKHYKIL